MNGRKQSSGTNHRKPIEARRQGMSQTPPERDDSDAWLPEAQPDAYGISADLVRTVAEALDRGDAAEARSLAAELHEADLADLLEHLDREERAQLIKALGAQFDLSVLTYLDVSVREEMPGAPAQAGRAT